MRTLLTALFMTLATQVWSDNLLKLDSFMCGPSVDQLTPILIVKDDSKYVDLVSGSPVSLISSDIFLFDTVAAEQKWLVYENDGWLLRQVNAGKIQYEYNCVTAEKIVNLLQNKLMTELLPKADSRILELQNSLSSTEEQLASALAKALITNDQLDKSKKQNLDFVDLTLSLNKHIDELEKLINDKTFKNDALMSENANLLNRLVEMDQEKKELSSKHKEELQKLIKQNASNHNALLQKYRSAINEKNRLSGVNNSFRKKIETLEAAIAGKPVKCTSESNLQKSSDIQLQNLGNRLNAALARAATEERKRRELEQKCVFIAE